jgi:hypothetical protein
MSGETWAIVAATALGPVFAVIVSFWRDGRKERRDRRLHVFRTLMATRQIPISNDHVTAINLVEVEFYKCRSVETAWKYYKDHLKSGPEDAAWRDKKEDLLARLLTEIASVLGFKIAAIDIFKGGYAPQGWANRDALTLSVQEFIRDLSLGKKVLPVWVASNPPPPNPSNAPPSASPQVPASPQQPLSPP